MSDWPRMRDEEFAAIGCMVGDMDSLSLGAQHRLFREAERARNAEARKAEFIERMLDALEESNQWLRSEFDSLDGTCLCPQCEANAALLREGGRNVH